MKNGRLQLKDIDDLPILSHLRYRWANGLQWGTWFRGFENCIAPYVGDGNLPDKLVMAKMNSLIRKGLVDGCPCGCRGDYVITKEGIEFIDATCTSN